MTKLNDTQYFKVKEIIYSNTAEKNNIDNYPKDEEVICNLNYTLQRLNEIREGYNQSIYITSGYRCEELNKLVGGVKNSKHQEGLAVDLRWNKKLVDYLIENCKFDKLIREKSKTSKWIHIQFRKENERQIVTSVLES